MKSSISQILISIFVLIGTALFLNGGTYERKKVSDLDQQKSTIVVEEISSSGDFEIFFPGFGSLTIADHLHQPAEQSVSINTQHGHFTHEGQGKLYILFHQLRVHS